MKHIMLVVSTLVISVCLIFAQKKEIPSAVSTNSAPSTATSEKTSKKAPLSQTEVEHLLDDVTKAYESRDLQRFMSYVPFNTVGRDRMQDAVRSDFATLFDIRLDRQDEKLVISEDRAVYEALWRRKGFVNEGGRMSSVSDERRSQMYLQRGLDGKPQLDLNHNPPAGGGVGGFPFVGGYDTAGTGNRNRASSSSTLVLTVNTSTSPNSFIIKVRDNDVRTASVTVSYSNGHADSEQFTINMESPGVFSRTISVTVAAAPIVTNNGVPQIDNRVSASTSHTFKYTTARSSFGVGGNEKTVTLNFP